MTKKIDRRAWLLKIFLLSVSLMGVVIAMGQLQHRNLQIRAITDAAAGSTAGEPANPSSAGD